MTPANVSKHYYAGVKIQEGSVYKKIERELKGVHLHANNIPVYFKNKFLNMVDDIQEKIANGELIDLEKYIYDILVLEKMIILSIKEGKPDIFRNGNIKEAKAYTQSEEESKYRYHILWNKVFGKKYGKMTEPPYTTYEIPITINTKAKVEAFKKKAKGDKTVIDALADFALTNFSNGMTSLNVPKLKLDAVGIPEEIIDIIDITRTVSTIMMPFYIVLETLGYYIRPDMTLSEECGLLEEKYDITYTP
jgi:hypothetical protein